MIVDRGPSTTVFRATRSSRQMVLRGPLRLLAACLVPALITVIVPAFWPVAVVLLVTPVASIAYGICFWLRSRFEFGGGRYRQVFAVRTHDFGLDDIAKVVAVDEFDYGSRVSAHLFIVGNLDRRLARLNDLLYERPQIEQLVADLLGRGVLVEHVHDRIAMREFDRLHPAVLNPWESHRVAFMLLTGVVMFALLAGATLLMLSLLGVFA